MHHHPEPRVADAVIVNVLAVDPVSSIIFPLSPATIVYAAVPVLKIISATPPLAGTAQLPTPFIKLVAVLSSFFRKPCLVVLASLVVMSDVTSDASVALALD